MPRLDHLGDLLGADEQRTHGGGVRAEAKGAVRVDGLGHAGIARGEDRGIVDETGEQG